MSRTHEPHRSAIGEEEYLALERQFASQAHLVPHIRPEEPVWPAEEARPLPDPRERILAGKAIGCVVAPESPYKPLSSRQKEILWHTSYGKNRYDISNSHDITPETVDLHLANVRKRLGATTTAQALHHAMLYSPPYPDNQPIDVSTEALQTLKQLACNGAEGVAPKALAALAEPLGITQERRQLRYEMSHHAHIMRRAHEVGLFFPVFKTPLQP